MRGKLKMAFLEKKKSRVSAFKKRKDNLIKKLQELTTLCDVGGCMIIQDPDQQATSIWPPDIPPSLIDAYNTDSAAGKVKFYCVSDYFAEKRRQVEQERKNLEAKHVTWDDCFSFMNQSELRDFADALQSKARIVRSRMQFLMENQSLNYWYEGQCDMLYNQTFNLDQVSFAAEGTKDAQQKSLQDEMMELIDVSNEIQESVGSYNVPDDIDEDDLMGELDALEADMRFETEGDHGVPSYLQPDLDTQLNLPSVDQFDPSFICTL